MVEVKPAVVDDGLRDVEVGVERFGERKEIGSVDDEFRRRRRRRRSGRAWFWIFTESRMSLVVVVMLGSGEDPNRRTVRKGAVPILAGVIEIAELALRMVALLVLVIVMMLGVVVAAVVIILLLRKKMILMMMMMMRL